MTRLSVSKNTGGFCREWMKKDGAATEVKDVPLPSAGSRISGSLSAGNWATGSKVPQQPAECNYKLYSGFNAD